MREILDKVYELFYYYDFPDDWALSKIILYSVDDTGNPLKEEDIYCNYLKFIDKEIDFFVSKNKQVEKF